MPYERVPPQQRRFTRWMRSTHFSATRFLGVRPPEQDEVLTRYGAVTRWNGEPVPVEGVVKAVKSCPTQSVPRGMKAIVLVPPSDAPEDYELSKKGDSGGIWYSSKDKMAVGVHVAGETSGTELALASLLSVAMERLGVWLSPESGPTYGSPSPPTP